MTSKSVSYDNQDKGVALAILFIVALAAGQTGFLTACDLLLPEAKKAENDIRSLRARNTLTEIARQSGFSGKLEYKESSDVYGLFMLRPTRDHAFIAASPEAVASLSAEIPETTRKLRTFFLQHTPEMKP